MPMSVTLGDRRFYVTGGSLPPDNPSYVERQADAELYDALQRREFCYVLTARQMGKSSLMVRTAHRLREVGVAVVVLDLTAVGQNLDAEQWYDGMLGLLARALNLEDELEEFWFQHERLGPLQRWMEALREVVLAKVPGQIVLFVDEIDAVRSLPFSADEFFAAIRECYNRRAEDREYQRLTFCLLGVAMPSDLIRDIRTTPFNIGRRIELNDFTAEEALPLAAGLVHPGGSTQRASIRRSGSRETGSPYAEARRLLKRVLYWTGGHPYLTQRLCQAAAEWGGWSGKCGLTRPIIPHSLVDRLCAEIFLSPGARERDDNLIFVRDRLLRSEVDTAGLLHLYEQVHHGRRVADDDTNPLVSVLRLSGIVRLEIGDWGLRNPVRQSPISHLPSPSLVVRNRIYRRVFDRAWITLHMPDAELRRQRAAFRRGVLRTATVSGVIMAAMTALSLIALDQARGTRRLLYVADMNVVQQALAEGNLGRARQLLAAHRPAAFWGEDLRGFEWYYLYRLCHGDRFTVGGHAEWVECVAFSPDGRWIATASGDRTAKLWDAATGREIRTLAGHQAAVFHVRFSGDGKTLVTIAYDQTVRFWDLETGRASRTVPFEAQWPLFGAGLSPDGQTLATRNRGDTITLRHLATGRVLQTLNPGPFGQAAFSPDNRTLATGSKAGVTLWEVKTGRKLRTLRGGRDDWTALAFSPEGGRLAAGGYAGAVEIWDVGTGKELLKLRGHAARVRSVAFAPDGRRLATASHDQTARVWDAGTGDLLLTLVGHTRALLSVAFSPDGRGLVTGSEDRTAKVWDAVRSGEMPVRLRGHTEAAERVAFSPDGKLLASASDDRTVKLWDVATRRQIRTLREQRGVVLTLAFSPDGALLAMGDADHCVQVREVATGREIWSVRGHTEQVQSVRFSPDGRTLATASGRTSGGDSSDSSVKLWDVGSAREAWSHAPYRDSVLSVAFSPDGRLLATGGRSGTLKLMEAATGRSLRAFEGGAASTFTSVAFSPDGGLLAAGNWDSTVTLWDVAATSGPWKPARTLQCASAVGSVAFSPDGRRVATARGDGVIKLWDIATEREVLTLKSAMRDTRLAVSPDGRRIAAGSFSPAVLLWEAASREEVAGRDARERLGAAPPRP